MPRTLFGFLLAAFTVITWGVTYVASRYLFKDFSPLEVQLLRFIIAYVALWIIYPKNYPVKKGDNIFFFLLGLTGAALYQFTENCAILYTNASNVAVIVALCPIVTALLANLLLKKKLYKTFFLGCAIALLGIALVSFHGIKNLRFHPLGDLLAFLGTFFWGFYSIVLDKVNEKGYPQIFQIRRAFFWTIILTLPLLLFSKTGWLQGSFAISYDIVRFQDYKNLLALLFLGLIASAACFVTWNKACEIIGTVRCTAGIYLCPVITIICASLLLKEAISYQNLLGSGLVLLGVFLATRKK